MHGAGLDALQVAREAVGLRDRDLRNAMRLCMPTAPNPASVQSVYELGVGRYRPGPAQGIPGRGKGPTCEPVQDEPSSTWTSARTPLGMRRVDAEQLETQRFQIEEICRDLKVFPQMVGYADKTATFASAELSLPPLPVIHTLNPWIENWEQSLALRPLPGRGRHPRQVFHAGLVARRRRRARHLLCQRHHQWLWLTRNGARRLEDMNPIDGLGEPLAAPRHEHETPSVSLPLRLEATDMLRLRGDPFELKFASDVKPGGSFSGYGAVFDNIDDGGDMIVKGAFADTLSTHWRSQGQDAPDAVASRPWHVVGEDLLPGVRLHWTGVEEEDDHGLPGRRPARHHALDTDRGRTLRETMMTRHVCSSRNA